MSEQDQEKKKVVFKVNFSKQEEMPREKEEPQMVTEWNYMRIAIAGLVMIVLIAVGINISQDEEKSEVTGNNVQGKQIKEAKADSNPLAAKATGSAVSKVKKQAAISSQLGKKQTSTKKPTQISGGLVRAQLAKGIWKNEPFGNITGSVKVNGEEATGIFYFTELENMKGKAVYHIWKNKGEVIFKKKKDILENRWRTYTSKLFTERSVGSWTVETVDSNNRQLNVINFEVVAEKD